MINELFWTKSDTQPNLQVIVSGDGAAVDLTECTGAEFLYKPRYTGTQASVTGEFASKSSGIVFARMTGVTSSIGPYWGWFKLYYPGGGIRSYPGQGGYINFEIQSGTA